MNAQPTSATVTVNIIDTNVSPVEELNVPSVAPAPPSNDNSDVTSGQGAMEDVRQY